jgi:hypothetical protein
MERSKVWQYYTKIKNEGTAQCKKCPKKISMKSSNTTGLVRHLENVHKISLKTESQPSSPATASTSTAGNENEDEQPPGSKKPKLTTQTTLSFSTQKQQSLGEIVSELAAKDGLTIRQITRSEFIRDSIQRRGFKLPNNETDVMNIILKYYEQKKKETIELLRQLRQSKDYESARFSLSIDEWSSLKNRRYFNICVHYTGGIFYNLGLVYIPGKCGASETRQIVETRLEEFGLCFEKDVVAVTSDGPNVMIKFGRESPTEMVLCLNHAIHLSVIATFSNKNSTDDESSDDARLSTIQELDENSDTDEDGDDELEPETSRTTHYPQNIDKALKETRDLVKLFRKSPLKNISLQKHVKQELGHELNLLMDVRTRWNSTMLMIERFLKLQNAVKKSLIDLNMYSKWNENNIGVLQSLLDILHPIKLCIEALSRRDATILTSEAILNVLMEKLRSMQNDLANRFLENLRNKIDGRRNVNLIAIIKYLHDPNDKSCSKTALINFTEELYNRLFPTPSDSTTSTTTSPTFEDQSSQPDTNEPSPGTSTSTPTFESMLKKAIENVDSVPSEVNSQQVTKNLIKREFNMYESTKKRTPNLERLFQALMTVKPTSTENERVFSLAANIVTKVRNRLSDNSINALIFLKAYFQRIN